MDCVKVAGLIVCFLSCLDLGIFELSDLINKVITECQGELMEVNNQNVLKAMLKNFSTCPMFYHEVIENHTLHMHINLA